MADVFVVAILVAYFANSGQDLTEAEVPGWASLLCRLCGVVTARHPAGGATARRHQAGLILGGYQSP